MLLLLTFNFLLIFIMVMVMMMIIIIIVIVVVVVVVMLDIHRRLTQHRVVLSSSVRKNLVHDFIVVYPVISVDKAFQQSVYLVVLWIKRHAHSAKRTRLKSALVCFIQTCPAKRVVT